MAARLVEQGDYVVTDSFIRLQVETASGLPEAVLDSLRKRIVEGGGGFPLVGSTDTIVERLALLSDAGVDGVLLNWVEYERGIERFAREVMPRWSSAGCAPHCKQVTATARLLLPPSRRKRSRSEHETQRGSSPVFPRVGRHAHHGMA